MTAAIFSPASRMRASIRALVAADIGGTALFERRRRHGLHHLSDEMLRDIGLEREDRMTPEARRATTRLLGSGFW